MQRKYTVPFLGGVGVHIPGALATDNSFFDPLTRNGDFRIDDIDPGVLEHGEMGSPFYRAMALFHRGAELTQPVYHWVENDIPRNRTIATLAAASDGTTITVDDPSVFQPGAEILVQRTKEIFRISRTPATAIPATNGIADGTIVLDSAANRGLRGSVAAAIKVGDVLVNLGTSLPERGKTVETNHQVPTMRTNYCQFWTLATSVTELQENTAMKYGLDFPTQVQTTYWKLTRQVAQSMVWGRRGYEDSATVGRSYYMDGFWHQLQSNLLDLTYADGALSWPVFNKFLENCASEGGSSHHKTLFAGRRLFELINHGPFAAE